MIRKPVQKKYSSKLNSQIQNTASLLHRFHNLGFQTNHASVRALIEGYYKIIYKANPDEIQILMIWEVRKNPEKLQINKLLDQ